MLQLQRILFNNVVVSGALY